MDEKLFKYLKIFASRSDFEFIIEKAWKYMEKLDEECQDDRMTCTVRPLCEKRRWLSILIKSGVNEANIPRFCYELQVKIVNRMLEQEKYFYEPEDCAIYLDDFFLLIFQGAPYTLAKMLENEEYDDISWKIEGYFRTRFNKVLALDLGESLILYVDEKLWLFDYIGNYMIYNVKDERIISKSILLALIKTMNRYYKHEVKVYEQATDAWILDLVLFEIGDTQIAQDKSFKEFLANGIGDIAPFAKSVNFKIEENKAHLLMEVKAYCGVPQSIYEAEPVTFGEITGVFKAMNDFKEAMDEWIEKNRASLEKTPESQKTTEIG